MLSFQGALEYDRIFKPDELQELLDHVRPNFRFAYSQGKLKYFNVPAAFDIETTSFYERGEKRAIMYVWQLGIYGCVIVGRTWEELISTLRELSRILDLNENKRLIIYVHSLSYEFQFMRLWFNWVKVFSLETRRPVYAVNDLGLEFRCSYILSGYNLEKVAEHLNKYHVKKMVGYLDYTQIRTSETPLTPDELLYCVNDVKVVMAYIQEQIEQRGKITKIPLTKTGNVREYCRNRCFYDEENKYKRKRYHEMMVNMTMLPDEYKSLKAAFQGGFTHANFFWQGKTIENVASFDFTSSYPAMMISEQFPMSAPEHVEPERITEDLFYKTLEYYFCVFDIELHNVEPKIMQESYISQSRCHLLEKPLIDNGRVYSAAKLRTTITGYDFNIIKACYEWDHSKTRIANLIRWKTGYLPKDFVLSVLELYRLKTELKGVPGKEREYLYYKELLNSTYGMSVTDPVRDVIEYNNGWLEPYQPDIVTVLEKYNKSWTRFLYYPWGVHTTAAARRSLFTGILSFGDDYIYSDTDSLKVVNADEHMDYINAYNEWIAERLKTALDFHELSHDYLAPKTKNGVPKPLGVWDYEGTYKRFKTLGAKRYMYEDDTGIHVTVAGVNKGKTALYLARNWSFNLNDKIYNNDPFERFCDSLRVPAANTGKLTHTYIDEEIKGTVTDCYGKNGSYYEKSFIHLEPAEYNLSLSGEYVRFLQQMREGYINA